LPDLQPYLGAYDHLVALRAADLGYLHVHPDEQAVVARARGGDIEVDARTWCGDTVTVTVTSSIRTSHSDGDDYSADDHTGRRCNNHTVCA
jgi:hypothetical protein